MSKSKHGCYREEYTVLVGGSPSRICLRRQLARTSYNFLSVDLIQKPWGHEVSAGKKKNRGNELSADRRGSSCGGSKLPIYTISPVPKHTEPRENLRIDPCLNYDRKL